MTAATTTEVETTTTIEEWHSLDARHRCDKCQSQAYVAALSPTTGTALLFCGHHYNTHADALEAQGFVVVLDERSKLTNTESGVHA